jgi:hypothetical protein
MSRRHVKSKPAPHYTTAEKLHMRRVKRKRGPSAVRRRQERQLMFTKDCGCIRAKHGLMPCAEHADPPAEIPELPEAELDEML